MSNTPSLLPCPFCGGMATAQPINSAPGWHHVTVLHSDCFYKPAQDQMLLNDEHLAAWNRRTPQPVVREPLSDGQCDAIYEALDSFGREVDHYAFGLPYCAEDGTAHSKEFARNMIREAAHGLKGGQRGAE